MEQLISILALYNYEIQNLFTSTDLYLYTGQYVGNGTTGTEGTITLTFPFQPIIFLIPACLNSTTIGSSYIMYSESNYPIITDFINQNYEWSVFLPRTDGILKFKKSSDGKTLSFYLTFLENSSNATYLNNKDSIYYYAAIRGNNFGGPTSWLITESGPWIVPKTRKYYIELYGGGRAGKSKYSSQGWTSRGASGGSSCQSYNNIQFYAGTSISTTIGTGGKTGHYDYQTVQSTSTVFGDYSVNGGGNATSITSGGVGQGNLGTNGSVSDNINKSNGKKSSLYGYGGRGNPRGQWTESVRGPRAVYLEYLGT